MTDSRNRAGRPVTRALPIAALALLVLAVTSTAAQPPRLIDYEMESQFEAVHTAAEVRDRVVVVIAAGRKGRDHTAAWGDAVRERLAGPLSSGTAAVVPVADLRGVPGFLKGRIRGRFPEEPERWVLMDWEGRFAEAYDLDEEAVSLLLFASDGALVTRMSTREVNEALVAHLQALVDEAVGTDLP